MSILILNYKINKKMEKNYRIEDYKYKTISKAEFEQLVKEIQSDKSSSIVDVVQMENGITQEGRYKISAKKMNFNPCGFTITCKLDKKEQKQMLTIEEKLKLFKEYYSEYKKIPEPTEKYKDFAIGKFYKKKQDDEQIVNTVNEIINN